jgi:hypothetical protein
MQRSVEVRSLAIRPAGVCRRLDEYVLLEKMPI